MASRNKKRRLSRPHALIAFAALTLAASTTVRAADDTPTYKDTTAPLESRVSDLYSRLTSDEKLMMLAGTGFATVAIPRLGLPEMAMCDAGQGVRGGNGGTQGPATLFPSGIAMAATWNPTLVGRIGKAIGEEILNKGTGAKILLGPDVNIHRTPLGGRNGESFSEDPYLAARLAVGYIEGMQSTGASSCIKHFACNNEEVDRDFVDVKVDERTLREIYLPAFEAGVTEAHSWSLMSSYNQVNGFHSSMNEYLLTEVLKKGWNWDGMVMSDWGGVHSIAPTVTSGNDLEMPDGHYLNPANLRKALDAGEITQAQIDEAVHRILRTAFRVGLLDAQKTPDHLIVNSPEHQKLTVDAAAEGITLLKNDRNILPLDPGKVKSIALIGPRVKEWQMGAYGSPYLDPVQHTGPMAGITRRAGTSVTLHYAEGTQINGSGGTTMPASAFTTPTGEPGLHAEFFANEKLEGAPVLTRTDTALDSVWNGTPGQGLGHDHFSARWTGKITAPTTGAYTFALRADDGCRLFLDGKQLIDHWVPSNGPTQYAKAELVAGKTYDLRVEYFQAAGEAYIHLNWVVPGAHPFDDAIAAAKASDVALVFVGTSDEGEGTDRPSMDLPGMQDDLIKAVVAANPNTVVIVNNGTPVTMIRWVKSVPGLLETWFPGQEGGTALAEILFGDVNPSGKLPDTLAMKREDYPDVGNFPGKNGVVHYTEGIYVGYRHFDKEKIEPLFPFGYGLSYTTFKYSNLKLSQPTFTGAPITATVDLTNTGNVAGAEVAELYIHDSASKIDRPVRELKGFQKLLLQPGETRTVTFTLDGRSFAYCDVSGKQWKADSGSYEIGVGSSSRDIRQKTTLRLPTDWTKAIPYMR